MATLVLSAVGSAFGGPIGSAIGAIVGQQIDQRLFRPKARHGPRLGDLAVQTSSYGTQIPKLFGTMRVAGTVIWSTDLVEHRSRSGGGKGRPRTVNYSYSASFAVALSGRPAGALRRIWADGKLLRGAAGDLKTAGTLRFHNGDEDQAPDPLIAAAEGGAAPAYRGVAYAVFEDLPLEDYGNRIPSISFEVEAEPGPAAIGAIAEALSRGAIAAGTTPLLAGYAASGDSVRSAIETLGEAVPLWLVDAGGALRLESETALPVSLAMKEENGRREVSRRPLAALPSEVGIAYHDVGRDFQTGLQRAVAGPELGTNAQRLALPAALDADTVKALAEHKLASLLAGRSEANLTLGWRRAGLRPGAAVAIEGERGLWRVRRWTLGPMTVRLELVRLPAGGIGAALGSTGRPVIEEDMLHGPTLLRLLDLPLGDPRSGSPLLLVVAAGVEDGWRRAELSASWDSGASWEAAGQTAPPAVLGTALEVLPAAGSALFDDVSAIEVALAAEDMWLESRTDAALVGGANLALIGQELVQFGRAEPLGGGRFRLSRLLRGRRGTEWAAELHEAGEDFVLIDPASLTALEAPPGSLGGTATILAEGIGDGPDGVEASRTITGESLRPPSPVHLTVAPQPGGDLLASWVRRSRLGWTWTDGSDTALGEEKEAYRLTLSGPGFLREIELDAPAYTYSAADQTADGATGPRTVSVVQIGTWAASRPATIILP